MTEKFERTPARDAELVREYLEEFPKPHIYSMEKAYTPNEYNKSEWQDFLREKWDHKLKIFKQVMPGGNAVIEGLPVVPLKDLNTKYLGDAVELEECIVSATGMNRPVAEFLRFKCLNCQEEFDDIPNQFSVSRPRLKCCSDQMLMEVIDKRDLVDAQWIRLQEKRRNNKISKAPITIPALMKGEDMIWSLSFNEKIKPMGILRYRTTKAKDGTKSMVPWFELYGYRRSKDVDGELRSIHHLSKEDIEWIQVEMAKPGYYQKLLESFAPHITGSVLLKEATLLTLASIKHTRPVRVLVVGDPSMAKSLIMEYATGVIRPDSFYVVMSDARKTGLTTTSVQDPDTGEWMVEPGVFAMADNSALFIDEFQQGRLEDIAGLNHVIERGKINYSLAGGNHGEFDANAAIMICCNAHTGLIGSEESVFELLKFVGKGLPAFLSRMNLVLFLRDGKTIKEEKEVAGSIYDHSGSDPLSRYKEDWYSPIPEEVEIKTPALGFKIKVKSYPNRFGTTSLRKILQYIIEYVPINPMPPELKDQFIDYYLDKSSDTTEKVSKLITPRFMRHIVNLTQVYARLHGRSSAIKEDMEHIFDLMLAHMSIAAYVPKTGEVDIGMLNGNIPRYQREEDEERQIKRMSKDEQFAYGCKLVSKESNEDGWFDEYQLTNKLAALPGSRWTYNVSVGKEIQKWVRAGRLDENGYKYKWMFGEV